jgi:hypothetical protein
MADKNPVESGPNEDPVDVNNANAGAQNSDKAPETQESVSRLTPTAAPLLVEVAILMDCTGSMSTWIQAAKDSALQAAEKIRESVQGCRYR